MAEETKKRKKKEKKEKKRGDNEDDADANPPRTRLRQETPFLCWMRFMLSLPEPPLPVRSFHVPIDNSSLSKFSHLGAQDDLSSRPLPLENGIGVSLDPLDLSQYAVNPNATLAPEDARLLTETAAPLKNDPSSDGATASVDTSSKAGAKPDSLKRRSSSQALQRSNAHSYGIAEDEAEDEEVEPYEEVERSFEKAKETPQHPTNPNVHAVEVLPVLPDFDWWPDQQSGLSLNTFWQLGFSDGDPMTGIESLKGASAEETEVCERSFLCRNFAYEGEKFIGMMAPKAHTRQALRERGLPDESEQPYEYEWIREYNFQLRSETSGSQQAFCTLFRGDKVTYIPVQGRITFTRHTRRRGNKAGTSLMPKVGPVSLGKRQYTDDEQQCIANARKSLRAHSHLEHDY